MSSWRQAVAQGQPAVLAQRKADARLEADVAGLERLLVEVAVAVVDVEPGEQVAVEQRRLDEAELEVAELGAGRRPSPRRVWPRPRKLRSVRLICAIRPSLRGEGAAEAEAAGRLLLDRRRRPARGPGAVPWRTLDRRRLEVAEAVDAVLGLAISRALKASPSTTRNWRRITRSSVRVLPVMSMRSMKTRSPSTSSKLMSTMRFAAFLVDPRADLDEGVARPARPGRPCARSPGRPACTL